MSIRTEVAEDIVREELFAAFGRRDEGQLEKYIEFARDEADCEICCRNGVRQLVKGSERFPAPASFRRAIRDAFENHGLHFGTKAAEARASSASAYWRTEGVSAVRAAAPGLSDPRALAIAGEMWISGVVPQDVEAIREELLRFAPSYLARVPEGADEMFAEFVLEAAYTMEIEDRVSWPDDRWAAQCRAWGRELQRIRGAA